MRNSKGFTLMELMVVVFIIAILVAAAVPSYLDNLKRTRYNESIVALQKVAQAAKTFAAQYPNHVMSGQITNAATNQGVPTCNPNAGGTDVLYQCGYLIKDNWDALAFNIYACNPATGAGGGCCKQGYYASMQYKNVVNDYCGGVDVNMELQENHAYDKTQ
ncbi:MAG: prepilin-type N-terminal cleavage/methylation domain-containing protein [Elusimicrobia bacterium]|nr:prepilin-type N-terminal cleavage/methylation domain-containing protein [Elusimicrobiota bacterium]